MPNMKAIKRRRLTVKNISQITKAMNLVATSKLQRARNALAAVAAPIEATFHITYNTVSHPDALSHPLVFTGALPTTGPKKKTAYVVMTGNRGLCGGYNSNVCKELIRHVKENDADPLIIPVGTKGRDYLRRRHYHVEDYPFTDPEAFAGDTGNAENNTEAATGGDSFKVAKEISDIIVDLYTSGQVNAVYIVYTKFITVLSLTPIVRQILPLDPQYLRKVLALGLTEGETLEDLGFFSVLNPGAHGGPEASPRQAMADMDFEPDLPTVLDHVIPWYLSMFLHGAYTSATLCEHAARMTSMDSSTKNAGDIIEKLTLQFNRQRQSIITQEITEIVSGANALE